MKKMPTYIKVAIIVVIVGVLGMLFLTVVLNKSQENRDPIILSYIDALNELTSMESTYHAKQEIAITGVSGEVVSIDYRDLYNDGNNFLCINTYDDIEDVSHLLVYDGYNYQYSFSPNKSEEHVVYKNPGVQFKRPWLSIRDYLFINDSDVTYKETDEQYIVTYVNKMQENQAVDAAYKEESASGFKSAVSVSYFDKEWKLQKILITEKWDSIAADGTVYERIRTKNIAFLDTAKEEIKNQIENEYQFLESLLE